MIVILPAVYLQTVAQWTPRRSLRQRTMTTQWQTTAVKDSTCEVTSDATISHSSAVTPGSCRRLSITWSRNRMTTELQSCLCPSARAIPQQTSPTISPSTLPSGARTNDSLHSRRPLNHPQRRMISHRHLSYRRTIIRRSVLLIRFRGGIRRDTKRFTVK